MSRDEREGDMEGFEVVGEVGLGEGNLAPVHTGLGEAVRGLVGDLKGKLAGSGIKLKRREDVKWVSFQNAVRIQAAKVGVRVSFRKDREFWYVYRKGDIEESRTAKVRQEEIALAYLMDGKTMDEIGLEFGVTRQRIQQIIAGYDKFSQLPIENRVSAVNEFIAPFLEEVGENPTCVLCKERPEGKNLVHGVCCRCAENIKMLTRVCSWLRTYKKTEDRRLLACAIMHIKKRSMKPEDLRGR